MHGAESERESGRSAFGRRSYMTALGALAATPAAFVVGRRTHA